MKRRQLLSQSASALLTALGLPLLRQPGARASGAANRLETARRALRQRLGDRLIRPQLPWANLRPDQAVPARLKNPWYLVSQPGGTQSTGMAGAWSAQASGLAVRAASANDVAAAVNVAREQRLRLVVKGAGGDYFGRSSGPADSLLIWTHDLNQIRVQRAFRPEGAPADLPAVPALEVSAGNTWLQAYQAATAAGLYVQGGGCTTVGACGGFTQGGGFGSYSKRFGSGAGNVLQLDLVTADGQLRTVNAYRDPELYWALKGGGGGTFGVVVHQTLLAHPIPRLDGWLSGSIEVADDALFEELLQRYLELVRDALVNPSWGEGIVIEPGQRRLQLGTAFLDLAAEDAETIWQPLLDPLRRRPADFRVQARFRTQPFERKWQPSGESVFWDRRPGAPAGQFWWKGNQNEVGAFWGGYQGRGIPLDALEAESVAELARAFAAASRQSFLLFQTNKGLAGMEPSGMERERGTSMNPAVLNNAGFITLARWVQYRYPGIPGHEPDAADGALQRRAVEASMAHIRAATPGGGSYVNEGDFFEPNWQEEFWGPHYPRLLAIKRRVDPTNLFRVHHGVGSDHPGGSES
jgi:FAD/FMN-containing dehydrogenase